MYKYKLFVTDFTINEKNSPRNNLYIISREIME